MSVSRAPEPDRAPVSTSTDAEGGTVAGDEGIRSSSRPEGAAGVVVVAGSVASAGTVVVADSAVATGSAAGAVVWTGVTAGTAIAAPVPVSGEGVVGVVSEAPVGCGFSEAGGRSSPVACGTAGPGEPG